MFAVTADLYKHAFESARKAEEGKYKAKIEDLLTDLKLALHLQSSNVIAERFTSASCK